MQTLIQAGADANSELLDGSNALMRATYFGRLETARVLIPATNVNHRDRDGVSALMLARWACNSDMVWALTLAGAKAAPGEWKRAPRYEDFRVDEIYKGVPAPVDLHSNTEAPMFRTRLREGGRTGPNFAGHFTAVSWGCGSSCTASMIVDARSGRVYDGIGAEFAGEFKLNSSLVIADAEFAPAVYVSADDSFEMTPVRYYVWNENRFKLLYEEPCSVASNHQRCGCEIVKEPLARQ